MPGTEHLMMKVVSRFLVLAAVVFAGTAAMSPAKTSAGSMTALRQLEKGQWELRERGAHRGEPPRQRICVGDPSQLLRAGQDGDGCDPFVVADGADRAVVTYQCRGKGTRRTDLRVETPRLVQIQSQGITDGAPFSEQLEARRTGDCN